MKHHHGTDSRGDLVLDLVEHLEALGISPLSLNDRAALPYLITVWGIAVPGGAGHADKARALIAGATSATLLIERAQSLMHSRAALRASTRLQRHTLPLEPSYAASNSAPLGTALSA